jgi:adenylate cyclase
VGLLVGFAAAAVALASWLPGALDDFEYRTWDWRVRLFARTGAATDDIVLVLLDQQSLDWGKRENGLSWPWPREMYAIVTDFCRRAGAKAVAFDVLYTEPSFYGVDDDAALGRAWADLGTAVGAAFLAGEGGSSETWPAGIVEPDLGVAGLRAWLDGGRPRLVEFPTADFPVEEIGSSARVLANTNFTQDRDGVYRRGTLFSVFDGRIVPSMGLAAYLAGNPGDHDLAVTAGSLSIDGHEVPIDRDGRAILRYRGTAAAYRPLGAAAVIQSELRLRDGDEPVVDPSLLAGKYVFFGFSAPGLLDLRHSPVDGAHPGVAINATVLDNLLSGDFMRTVALAPAVALLVLLCLAAGVAVASATSPGRSGMAWVVFLPLAPLAAVGAYALGWWLELVPLEAGVLVSLAGASLASYATEGRQRRFLKGAFSQYLSPAVIERIIADPGELKLGGERRELSIFFSDIEGFTGISEKMEPEALTDLMNDYLTAMTGIIQEEGGTLDKYIGDAIVAFWNAPVELADHPVRAVRAALRCQEKLSELRPGYRALCGADLRMRIGLNWGPVVVGNLGSRTRFAYTMLGDAVNLASRLEGANKAFGTYAMMSADLHARLGGAFPARELGRIQVKGRREPLAVLEPMTATQLDARRAVLEAFDRGLRAWYEGRFEEAVTAFEAIAADDPPAARYAAECRGKLKTPHAGPWTGVLELKEK